MTSVRCASTILCSVVLALASSLAAPAHAATGTGADFAPSVVLDELHLAMSRPDGLGGDDRVTIHWRGDRIRRITSSGQPPERHLTEVARGTEVWSSLQRGVAHRVSTTRGMPSAAPDALPLLHWDIGQYVWPVVASIRRGEPMPATVRVGGRPILRATVPVTANDCAGMRAGTRRVDLDARTLVPVRVVERRGGRLTLDMTVVTRAPRASDFAPIRTVGRGFAPTSLGFVRRTPAQAAAALALPVQLPTSLPAGFRRVESGTGARGGVLGPEGYFPRSGPVFYTTWRRGFEELHLTIRQARTTLAREWDRSDPFGAECASSTRTDTMVGSHAARYAYGDDGAPRLWWRDGATLYTLSGAFSAEQLVTIANSLATIPG